MLIVVVVVVVVVVSVLKIIVITVVVIIIMLLLLLSSSLLSLAEPGDGAESAGGGAGVHPFLSSADLPYFCMAGCVLRLMTPDPPLYTPSPPLEIQPSPPFW